MRRLLIYLKEYRRECIIGPLFKLLEAGFELFVPLVVAVMIDRGIAQQDRSVIFSCGGLLLALAAVGLTCSVAAQHFAAKASVGFAAKLRHALFAHVQLLSFSQMDEIGTSTLITRQTSDINQIQSGVNLLLRLFLRSPFIVFGAMGMAFFVDVPIALLFVVAIPLLCVVIFGIMALSMPRFTRVQKKLDSLLLHTQENLQGARVIRAFSREKEETQKFEEDNQTLSGMQMAVGRLSALTNPLTYIILNGATIVLLWVGGRRVYFGRLSQGEVVALVNYMAQILAELIKLANLIVSVSKALSCANRVADVLDLEPEIAHGSSAGGKVPEAGGKLPMPSGEKAPAPHGAALAFCGVWMRYRNAGADALLDIDFSVEAGSVLGIIGGTGSGKSTLVHLIPRFYEVSKGAVLLDGKDVREYPLFDLRQKVAVVMQECVPISGTIADNLRMGKPDADEEEMWEALRVAQAKDFVQKKPEGLSFAVGEDGRSLSGGQRQRLLIARALIRRPDVLILDDSSSALDFATVAALRRDLLQWHGNTTLLIVSQRVNSVRFADQILVLDGGRIAGFGTHEKLLCDCQLYRQIAASQEDRSIAKGGAR